MTHDAGLQRIDEVIKADDVVLFMKGSTNFPQCGFSAAVVDVLQKLHVKFKDIDVLADPEIRDSVKRYANWPTIPQLYIKGEFVGGCDIVREMAASGELQSLLKEKSLLT